MAPRKKAAASDPGDGEPQKVTPKGADAPPEDSQSVQVPVEAQEPESAADGDGEAHPPLVDDGWRRPTHPDELPPLVVTPERGDVAQQRSDAAQQFPSLRGEPEVEVAERSADNDKPSMRFVKQFVIKVVGDTEAWLAEEETHVGHKLRVLEEAIQRGLHAKGDVKFEGAEDHWDKVSKVLTYSVKTVPAAVDSKAVTTMTVSNNETTGDCPVRDALGAPSPDTSK